MTQEEMKERLTTLERGMKSVKENIDTCTQRLGVLHNTYSDLMRSYMNLDRELALLDGRFKVINLNVSGIKKPQSNTKLLSKMTPLEKAKLFEELRT